MATYPALVVFNPYQYVTGGVTTNSPRTKWKRPPSGNAVVSKTICSVMSRHLLSCHATHSIS